MLSAQRIKCELYCRIVAIAPKMPKIKDVKRKEQLKGSELKLVLDAAMSYSGTAILTQIGGIDYGTQYFQ